MVVAGAFVDEQVAVVALTVGGDFVIEIGEESLLHEFGKVVCPLPRALFAVDVDIDEGEVAPGGREVARFLALEMLHQGLLRGATGIPEGIALEKTLDHLAGSSRAEARMS